MSNPTDKSSRVQSSASSVTDVKEVKTQKDEPPESAPLKVNNFRERIFVADPIRWNKKVGFVCYSPATGQVIRTEPIKYNGVSYTCGLPNLPSKVLILPDGLGKLQTPTELLDRITNLLRRVFVAPSEDHLAIMAIHILGSWNFDLHESISYIFFVGLPECGKSAGLKACGHLSFNTFWASGSSSLAAVVRMIDRVKGTLALDEAQRERSENNPTSDYHKMLVEGNQRDGLILKCKDGKGGFEPEALFVFCPKYLAGRSMSTDDAVTSRAVEIRLSRLKSVKVAEISDRAWQDEARSLRNDLLLYRQIRAFGEPAPGEKFVKLLEPSHFNPREIQVFRWLLKECPNELVATQVIRFLTSRRVEVQEARSQSFEHQVLLAIYHLIGTQCTVVDTKWIKPTGRVLLVNIADCLVQWGHAKPSSKVIAGTLRDCGVEIGHSREGDYVKWGRMQIAAVCARLGYPDPESSLASLESPSNKKEGSK